MVTVEAVLPARAALVPWIILKKVFGASSSRLTRSRSAKIRERAVRREQPSEDRFRKMKDDDTNIEISQTNSKLIVFYYLSALYPHLLNRVNSDRHDERNRREVQGRRQKRPSIYKGCVL
jgi:hypothetical protein